MNFQDDVEKQISHIKDIEGLLKLMSESSSIDLVEMKAEDGARLNLCLAYSISSLYFVYLKLNGVETQTNPIMQEIERVQKQFERFNKLTMDHSQQTDNNRPRIDGQAAQRLIKGSAYNKNSQQDQKMYEKKQKTMIQEDDDYSRRLDISKLNTEKHQKQSELQSNLNIWDDEPAVQKKPQKMVKGSLSAKTGHLDWKKTIEDLLK